MAIFKKNSKKTIKNRDEIKRRNTRNSQRKSKRKSSKYKNKLEFHTVNPLYTYLICIMCLRSWKKFIQVSVEQRMNFLKKQEKSIPEINIKNYENVENVENNLISAVAVDKSNVFENDGMEMYIHSYLVVPNYIPENQ